MNPPPTGTIGTKCCCKAFNRNQQNGSSVYLLYIGYLSVFRTDFKIVVLNFRGLNGQQCSPTVSSRPRRFSGLGLRYLRSPGLHIKLQVTSLFRQQPRDWGRPRLLPLGDQHCRAFPETAEGTVCFTVTIMLCVTLYDFIGKDVAQIKLTQ